MKKFKILLYCLSIIIPVAFFVTAGCLMPSPSYTGSPGGTSGPTISSSGCFPGSNAQIRSNIFYLVNSERQSKGLTRLTCDMYVSNIAQNHAMDMARRNYFSHISPEGKNHTARLNDAGTKYILAGENLAWGQNSGKDVVVKWMNSSGHRANILYKDFNAMGIGAYKKYYVLILIKK
jgi:uncharacterized protein YkwD